MAEKQNELKFYKELLGTKPDHKLYKATAERLKAEIDDCRIKLRESKSPKERMEGKCKRSRKLEDLCSALEKKRAGEQKLEEQAYMQAELHGKEYEAHLEEYDKHKEEITRLSRETQDIIQADPGYDAGSKVIELWESECDGLREQLEDELLDHDGSIKEAIPELEGMREQFSTVLKRMAEIRGKVGGAQKVAAEAAATRAKETAKDADEAAATAVKASAAPGAAASGQNSPAEAPGTKNLVPRAAARHRAGGLGRWNTPLAIAWEKPVHNRSPEEVVQAARASKIARTERAEEAEMDADLASS